MSLTEQDLELRMTGISASEAAAVLGLSPFSTPAEVWAEKVGLKERDPQNNYMEWGHRLEAVVLEKYNDETDADAQLWRAGTVQHHQEPCIMATPDAVVGDYEKDGYLVEVKTCSSWDDWGEPGTDEIPKAYLLQVMQQMEVLDIDRCDIAVLNVRHREFRIYHVLRDRKAGADLVAKLVAWWDKYVVGGVAPEVGLNDVNAGRAQEGEPIVANDEDRLSMQVLASMRKARKGFEENEKAYIETLKTSLGLCPGIEDPETGNKVVYKLPKQKSKVDWQALARELGASPEDIIRHTRKFTTKRSFRFYPGESK